jgi:hypothetical protein
MTTKSVTLVESAEPAESAESVERTNVSVSSTKTKSIPISHPYTDTLAEALDLLEHLQGRRKDRLEDPNEASRVASNVRRMFQIVRRLYLDSRFAKVFETYDFIDKFCTLRNLLGAMYNTEKNRVQVVGIKEFQFDILYPLASSKKPSDWVDPHAHPKEFLASYGKVHILRTFQKCGEHPTTALHSDFVNDLIILFQLHPDWESMQDESFVSVFN